MADNRFKIKNGLLVEAGGSEITGSLIAPNITGSLFGTASWAMNALTASFAVSSSYITNVIVSGAITNADYIQFNTTASVTDAVGRLYYDNGEGTIKIGLAGGNVVANIGEDLYQYVYNNTGAPLTKGQVVYISGSQGNRIAVKLASATAEQGSANTLGFVAEAIGTGGEGWIQTEGVLRKMNTTGLVGGQLIYLSSSAGQYTQTKPQAPLHEVRLGYAERIDATVGSIYIKIDNGYELDELHNVRIIDEASGDLFVNSGSLWINSKQLTGSYGLTGSLTIGGSITASSALVTGTITAQTLVVQTITSSVDFVTGSTRFGSLLTNTHQFTGSVSVTGSLNVNGATAITGIGSSSQVAYWNGTTSQTGSETFTFSPTAQLLVNNSVTASSAIARGTNLTPSLTAAANNDVLVGLDVNPTTNTGSFTGVSSLSARFIGNVLMGSIPTNISAFTYVPLTLHNSGTSGQIRTQLALLNTAGNINTGTAIDFFTYTDAGNGNPGLRIAVVDDGNFSGNLRIFTKAQGSSGNGALSNKFQIFGGTGNVLIQNGGTFTDTGHRLLVSGSGTSGSLNMDNTLYVSGSRVGIGTSTPAYTLDVNGPVSFGTAQTFAAGGSSIYAHSRALGNITVNTTTYGGVLAAQYNSITYAGNAALGDGRLNANFSLISNTGGSNITTGYFSTRTQGSGNGGNLKGLAGDVAVEGSGNVTNATAIESTITRTSGNITNAYGIRIANLINTSSGAMTNTYGLFIGDMTTGSQTNQAYSLFVSDSQARNYIAGNTGFGTISPSASLHISGSTGILFEIDSDTQNNILYVTSSGNVGIGTSNPRAKLHVALGEIRVDAGQAVTLDSANNMYLVGASNQLRLYNNSIPALSVTTTGRVLIGTITDGGYRLDVSGSARISDQLYIESASVDYQQNLSLQTGSWQTIVASPTGSYRAAFFDYAMFSGSIGRAGTVTTFWSASATEFYENYTEDLGGSTAGVVLQTAISASQIVLQATASSAAWTIRSLVRLL